MYDPERAKKPSSKASTLLDLGLTIALPLSTQLAKWTGHGRREVDQARETEGPVTPATGAFVIWAPIFAGIIGYGAQKTRLSGEIQDRSARNLLRASLVGNILWSLNSQFRDFGWQSVALIGASALTATASVARYERLGEKDRTAKVAANLIAPLAGWLSVATFANLDTTQRFTNSRSRSWLDPDTIIPIAAITAACGVVATKANPFYTAAAGWGLGGIAVKNARRRPKLASKAVVGLLSVAALAVTVGRRR